MRLQSKSKGLTPQRNQPTFFGSDKIVFYRTVIILLAALLTPVLPYLLAFAAGAMLYVVVEELIPEASHGKHSNLSTIVFAIGFVLMMVLDVVLG